MIDHSYTGGRHWMIQSRMAAGNIFYSRQFTLQLKSSVETKWNTHWYRAHLKAYFRERWWSTGRVVRPLLAKCRWAVGECCIRHGFQRIIKVGVLCLVSDQNGAEQMSPHSKNNYCHPTLAICFTRHRWSDWHLNRNLGIAFAGSIIGSIAFPKDDGYSRTLGYYTHTSWLYHTLDMDVRMPRSITPTLKGRGL